MKTQTRQTSTVAAAPAPRLGSSHGYRFDGDTVFLNASFHADAGADLGRAWSLRLVAGTDVLAGHIVTEVALPPLSELTGAVDNYEVAAGALFPAARGHHVLTLALVARDAAGDIELHDTFTYALAQAFAQPRLSGPVGLWFESDDELVLDLDHIENPRDSDNLSGTLSVEVWALDNTYTGGSFEGQPVAGAILGSLAGGQSWQPGALHLRAAKPADARAHLVVMLREWNGAAYVTRDFVSFTPAPVVEAASVVAPVAASAAPAESAAPAAAAVEAPAKAPAKKSAKASDAAKLVSVNSAPADVLASVKGLNKTVATEIVKKRPFSALDELAKIKGIGPKTFEKLKAFLKL